MALTSDELLPCPFCGGMAHVRRKIAYRRTGRRATVFDFQPGMPEFGTYDREVENEVDVLDWRFGFQVWCGRCKTKTQYKWGPWHAYTADEIEELGREDFYNHAPNDTDEPAKLAAIDVWNRRASDDIH
jgi:hypothetical protein